MKSEYRYKAVVFDMDGTLLNTLDDIAGSVNHVLKEFGREPVSLEQVRRGVGNGGAHLIAHVLPLGKEDPKFREMADAHASYYETHCRILTAPYPGVSILLEKMVQEGIQAAIVSNKGDGAVRQLADFYFPGLIRIAVGERKGIRRKPAPDTILEALRQMNVSKADALYVGDSEVDIESAGAAGIPAAIVTWGFRDRDEMEKLHPAYLADTAAELEQIIFQKEQPEPDQN